MLLISSQSHAINSCNTFSDRVTEIIDKQNEIMNGALVCGDDNRYHSNSVEVAFYSIEGACYDRDPKEGCGNHHEQYMVAIIDNKEYPPIKVGGKLLYAVDKIISVKDGIIELGSLEYSDSDGMCCPSVEVSHFYEINKEKIEKIESTLRLMWIKFIGMVRG